MKAGQVPGRTSLNVLQLILWGLEDPKNQLYNPENPNAKEDLTEIILRLMFRGWPRNVHERLTKKGPDLYGAPWIVLGELKEMGSPKRTARYLID